MPQLPISRLLGSLQLLTQLQPLVVEHARTGAEFMTLHSANFPAFLEAADALASDCGVLNLAVSKSLAQDISTTLRTARTVAGGDLVIEGHHIQQLDSHLRGIAMCLGRESSTRTVLVLSSDKAALFESREPHFGQEVRSKFPSAIHDIDEAAKCLALGRTTACVFHLMRSLEIVLKAVHACVGASQPRDRNWTSWLAPIRDERVKRGGTKWAENDFFQDVWQRLDSIKDSQRNSTMHVESSYTEEEARVIFDNTGAFMKKVASRMDEKGLPLA